MIFGARPYGNIIQDSSLVLSLDATNPASYPGNGTTWFDRSGYNNNGTLTNGPTYLQERGRGSFTFNGSNTYCTVGGLNLSEKSMTVSFTFKSNTTTGLNDWKDIVALITGSLSIVFERGGSSGGPSTTGYLKVFPISYTSSLVDVFTPGVYIDDLKITQYTLSTSNTGWTIYQNGNINATGSVSGSNSTFTSLVLGTDTTRSSRYFSGTLYNVQIYNRALSAQEVLQNYNALKSRFV